MNQDMSISTRSSIVLWLLSGCFLIFSMVVVGGITRLTGSGLSITKWKIVTGTVPPLNDAQWIEEFNEYKNSPQFNELNSHFSIEDFKGIYWWEYLHRLLGRVIGIVFIIPFLYFLFSRKLNRPLIYKCLLLFFMGGLQGFVGWYMVKSGLVDIPSVSHFRLALHLITAFITFGLTFWFAMDLIHTGKVSLKDGNKKLYRITVLAFIITVIQIIFGAFVAGLDAGFIYNTWPLMGEELIAESFYFGLEKEGISALVSNMSGVQVVHRYLAYIVVAIIFFLAYYGRIQHGKKTIQLSKGQLTAINLVLVSVVIQFILGVVTLIYNVPVTLGVLHQIGAFFLFASLIYLLHRLKNVPLTEVNSK